MAQHGHLTREEKKKIRVERKKLCKDLRERGITKRQEFEKIAQMLGLVYGDDYPRLLWLWWRLLRWLAGLPIWCYLLASLVPLGILFPLAVLANQKGNFVVKMTETVSELGLELSEHKDLSETKTRLESEVLHEVNAFTVMDIPENINAFEGSYNLDNVLTYTFWATNTGSTSLDYSWYLIMTDSTKHVDEATWLMVFDEDGMVVYAKRNAQGLQEKVADCFEPPFMDVAAKPEAQYMVEDEDSMLYTILPTEWDGDHLVTKKQNRQLKAGEAQKYTVVIWIEGYDQDCDDSMIGGHAGFRMIFTAAQNDSDLVDLYLPEE